MINKLKKFRLIVSIALLSLLITGNVFAETETNSIISARQVVEDFQAELIEVMKQGAELKFSGRYGKLDGAIRSSHDLTKIARIVVGREWQKLTEEQQTQLVNEFARLSIASYAHNFKEHTGESFSFVAEEKTARGGIIIHSLLVIPDDRDVKFDYMMKKIENNWKIINIIANGVSDLALKRSEYTSILKRQGFDALIAKITEKTDNYAKQ